MLRIFASEPTKVKYRDRQGFLWKNDFLKLFTDRSPTLKAIKEKKFKYPSNDNVEVIFLLQKRRELMLLLTSPYDG